MTDRLPTDMEPRLFYEYKRGYILPLIDLEEGTPVSLGECFLRSFLVGRFVKYNDSVVAYYFTSQFQMICDGSFLIGFSPSKAGKAKESNRIVSNEDIVVVEYPDCGTLVLDPSMNSVLTTILEEQ